MAKKKRESEEWKEPEFDEVDFMRKEIRLARGAIVTVLWAVPAALIGYTLTIWNPGLGPALAFLAGVAMLYLLKWVFPRVGVITGKFKRRDWVGHTASFLFSWLAFWILLLNAPFADLTAPTITAVTVNGMSVSCGGSVAAAQGLIVLNVTASDNVGVAGVSFSIGSNAPNPLSRVGNLWQASFTAITITPVTVVASDTGGRSSSCGFTLDAR